MTKISLCFTSNTVPWFQYPSEASVTILLSFCLWKVYEMFWYTGSVCGPSRFYTLGVGPAGRKGFWYPWFKKIFYIPALNFSSCYCNILLTACAYTFLRNHIFVFPATRLSGRNLLWINVRLSQLLLCKTYINSVLKHACFLVVNSFL